MYIYKLEALFQNDSADSDSDSSCKDMHMKATVIFLSSLVIIKNQVVNMLNTVSFPNLSLG